MQVIIFTIKRFFMSLQVNDKQKENRILSFFLHCPYVSVIMTESQRINPDIWNLFIKTG